MKRIFTSFAIEDQWARDMLRGQSRNESSPFEFIDMSVKEPWDNAWKTKCRTRIRGCHGMIIFVSKNTKNADGQLWEIKCAKEECIPTLGIYVEKMLSSLPSELSGIKVVKWTWENIENFLKNL